VPTLTHLAANVPTLIESAVLLVLITKVCLLAVNALRSNANGTPAEVGVVNVHR
jgi:hypothetical protein